MNPFHYGARFSEIKKKIGIFIVISNLGHFKLHWGLKVFFRKYLPGNDCVATNRVRKRIVVSIYARIPF